MNAHNRDMRTMKHFLLITFCIVSTFVLPLTTLAAEMWSVSSSKENAGVGKEIAVELFLDTEGEAVSGLRGSVAISFRTNRGAISSQEVSISRIRDGDSIVGVWVTKANTNDPDNVSFEGIIPVPGGMTTAKGKVLTLYFVVQQEGILDIVVTGIVLSGPLGASSLLRPNTLSIPVSVLPKEATVLQETKDTTPPESVRAAIYQNEEMFDGKPFIIVNAKDTESGIATYELLETEKQYEVATLIDDSSLPWRLIDNPAPLLSSEATGFIYLRVTDREGNAAVVEVSHPIKLSPENWTNWFNKWLISSILIGAAGLFLWLWFLWRRHRHHA